MELIISSADLGKALRITAQRVNQLVKEGVLKRTADGKFDLPTAIEDYYTFKFKDNDVVSYEKEHAQLEAAKRRRAEMELKEHEGKLLDADDVEKAVSEMILTAKSRMLSIPTRVAPAVIGQTNLTVIVGLIKKEVAEALNELSEMPAPPKDGVIDAED